MNKTIEELLSKPVWQMTGEELLAIAQQGKQKAEETKTVEAERSGKRYVYGISGIAQLFGCSKPTANRIKQSGKIDRAITQIGRKIIVDADLALDLADRKPGTKR